MRVIVSCACLGVLLSSNLEQATVGQDASDPQRGKNDKRFVDDDKVSDATVTNPPYRISAEAEVGQGFGVARLSIENIPAEDKAWAFDQVVQVRSEHCHIWLPARPVFDTAEALRADSVELYFLFHGGFPTTVDLYLDGQLVRSRIPMKDGFKRTTHANALAQWWEAFSEQSEALAIDELAGLNQDLLASLGQLLGLAREQRKIREDNSLSQLEKEFERTLGMLLGFESVRLAMMTDDSQTQVDDSPARLPIPRSLNVAGLRLPPASTFRNAPVIPIAKMIPQDCYMVRCGSLENYLWLRGLLVDWGGSLSELVSRKVVESDVRARLEKQLALRPESLETAGVDSMLEDMALIGSDVLFNQGAGLGVLLQARPGLGPKLENTIQLEREAIAVRPKRLTIDDVDASLLLTPDNRIRSYFLRLGDFVLVTNSSHIAQSVVRTRLSGRSLANLAEFKYAMATNPHSGKSKILFYLSDPFFRRLASSPFRVELGRRRASEADCRRLEMAALIAEATGHPATDKVSLIDASVLPTGFGQRSDGSVVEFQDGEALDTMRGKPGTFVPVVDVAVKQCNASERSAYQAFSAKYRREWRVMDPVLASLDAEALDGERERLELSVHITPYARQEYQFLTQYLGAPSLTCVSAGADQLMGVSASLQDRGRAYGAHLGVLDRELDFSIQHGQVVVDGQINPSTFVDNSSFAAVTPSDTQGLLILNGLMKSLQQRKPIDVPRVSNAPQSVRKSPPSPNTILRSIFYPGELLLHASMTAIEQAAKASVMANITQDERWAVYATSPDLHERVRTNLVVRKSSEPAEIHAAVNGVGGSAIKPYLEAFTFCEARRKSAKVAAWLNHWATGLNVDPAYFRTAADLAAGGEIVCPLEGRWEKSTSYPEDTGRWISSKWQASRLTLVNRVPEDYRFAFLDWFQGLELRFSLTNTSLVSDIRVNYKPSSDRNQYRLKVDRRDRLSTQASMTAPFSLPPSDLKIKRIEEPLTPSSDAKLNSSTAPQLPGKADQVKSQSQRPSRPSEIGIRINPSTMVVSLIKPGQPAARSTLRAGDRILELNGMSVTDLESLRSGISVAGKSTGLVNLVVERHGRQLDVKIQLEPSGDVDL